MMDGEGETEAGQAAEWYARLHAPGADAREDHDAWLRRNAAHRTAWHRVERADAALEAARDSDAVRAMIAGARGAAPRRSIWRYAVAAGLVLATGGAGLVALRGLGGDRPAPAPLIRSADYATAVGERRTVALADGSVLTLDTGSRVHVALGGPRREIALEAGQAFFKVAKDRTHPFVVSAGGNTVTALGTQFDVRVDADRFTVALVEGKVRVVTPIQGRENVLHPGQMLIARGKAVSVTPFATRPTEWMDGHVRFDAVPLSQAVAEMNRYYAPRIVLGDSDLAREPVSGVFRTDGGAAFVDALAQAQIARVDRRDGAQIVLRRF